MLRTRLIARPSTGFVLSAAFAAFATALVLGPSLIEPLRVVPGAPAPIALRRGLSDPPEARFIAGAFVRPGEVVVAQTPDAALVAKIEQARRPPSIPRAAALFFVYFLLGRMITAYIPRLSPSRGALLRTQVGLLALMGGLLTASQIVLWLTPVSELVLPAALIPLWAAHFLDRRTGLIVGFTMSLALASLVGFRWVAVATFIASSLTATGMLHDRKHPGAMAMTGVTSGAVALGVAIIGKQVFDGGVNLAYELAHPFQSELLAAALGGPIAGGLALLLQPIPVIALGAVSRQRLLELTDLDQPLLRKMAAQAPGSWEHARAMANLAEAASAAIGADALLTRVGAYYHDLGKTCQPKYFIENLDAGEVSPHVELEPEVSADAIMAHVVEGTRILRGGAIPEPVVEFAYTHHGTSVIEYFWHKCIEQGNPKGLAEHTFRYPGMRPRTRETAILMLVDSIEAAARTIDPPSREKFDEMVQRIVFVKLRQGQLDESGLEVEDLRTLAIQLVETLCNVYHARIKYPWQNREAGTSGELPEPGVATEEDLARARHEDGVDP